MQLPSLAGLESRVSDVVYEAAHLSQGAGPGLTPDFPTQNLWEEEHKNVHF